MPVKGSSQGIYRLSFDDDAVISAFSGRQFMRGRFAEFVRACGLEPESLATLRQVHGDGIRRIGPERRTGVCGEGDGLITDQPGSVLGILTADCLPVFYYDPEHRACGIAHAGWKGLRAGIVTRMVRQMASHFHSRPEALDIGFGPAIRPCCYAVGPEFESYFGPYGSGGRMDLAGYAKQQLQEAGVAASRVRDSGLCTACAGSAFYSARREGTDERMISVIALA